MTHSRETLVPSICDAPDEAYDEAGEATAAAIAGKKSG
jgi:hypothetical protein